MNRIKELRTQAEMKQATLAEVIHCTPASLSLYESGKVEPPISVYITLADYFGVTLDYLLCHSDAPHGDKETPPHPEDEAGLTDTQRAIVRVLESLTPEQEKVALIHLQGFLQGLKASEELRGLGVLESNGQS